MPLPRVGVAGLLALIVGAGGAQSSGQAQARQSEPTFKAATELVLVNVVVRDKSGAIVGGLTRDDFTVLEDGKPQSITRSEFEQLDRVPAAQPVGEVAVLKATRLPTGTSAAPDLHPAVPAAPDLHDRRLVVLFFDLTSMQPEETTRSLAAATRYAST